MNHDEHLLSRCTFRSGRRVSGFHASGGAGVGRVGARARILAVPASECIVIEDAPAGTRSGKAAGARVLALRTTASDAELQQAGADWIVNDCADLFRDSSAAGEEYLLFGLRAKKSGGPYK